MTMKSSFVLLALATSAASLSAQIVVRSPTRDRVIVLSGGEVARANDKIPPGHLPPRGMCRVWIDGVPPGQQPQVTDCATAERNRVANSRVIYGDRESFPGRRSAKFKRAVSGGDVERRCTVWDAVVVDGRIVNVCRDDSVRRSKQDRDIRRNDGDDDDDDKLDKKDKSAKVKVKANKADKKGKGGDHDDRND